MMLCSFRITEHLGLPTEILDEQQSYNREDELPTQAVNHIKENSTGNSEVIEDKDVPANPETRIPIIISPPPLPKKDKKLKCRFCHKRFVSLRSHWAKNNNCKINRKLCQLKSTNKCFPDKYRLHGDVTKHNNRLLQRHANGKK